MTTKRNAHSERYNVALGENVIITLMGKFNFIVGAKHAESEILRSKKGFQLMAYLIVNREETAPLKTLYGLIWPAEKSGNPENALKTQVSRIRTTLNRLLPALGDCIVNSHGGYSWKQPENMKIDLYEIDDLLIKMRECDGDDDKIAVGRQISRLYKGDLLSGCDCDWARDTASRLHEGYFFAINELNRVYAKRGDYDEIIKICRAGLEIDAFNDSLHAQLMDALAQSDRTTEALDQYKHAVDLHCRYRGEQPSALLQKSYKRLTHTGGSLDAGLIRVMRDLNEHGASSGAFLCEYSVFREVYALQMRNLERLGMSIFLCVIMISDIDGQALQPLMQSEVIRGAISILIRNLRRGDTITQISPMLLATLLPSVDYSTGNAVLDRIKSSFFLKYPNSGIVFSFRLSPLEERPSLDGGVTLMQ